MEKETYTFGDYFNEVKNRAKLLSDKEKATLNSLQTSPQGAILVKVLGSELSILRSMIEPKKKRGLAARK